MTAARHDDPGDTGDPTSRDLSRRSFVGFVLAGSTLAVAADLSLAGPSYAAVPSPAQIPETYDLEDLQTDSARPTANLITVVVHPNGRASFSFPRAEVGQGITTAAAMIIAEELDIAVTEVDVTLSQARQELVFNQLTGGSNTMVSMFTPIRVAAAIAKGALLQAAAIELGSTVALLQSKNGVVTAPRSDGDVRRPRGEGGQRLDQAGSGHAEADVPVQRDRLREEPGRRISCPSTPSASTARP